MVEIRAPEEFPFVLALAADGPLDKTPILQDPRRLDFAEREVVFDLRGCLSLQFPAVLWCLVYAALAQRAGANCLVLPPYDLGATGYLQEVGFYQALGEAGVAIEGTDASQSTDSVVVLPVTRFETIDEAQDLAEKALWEWDRAGQVAANLRIQASETFGELANNALEHAQSPVGALGVIQFYRSSGLPREQWRLACAVSDGGSGIKETLRRNPRLQPQTDLEAIELALAEGNSGTGDPHRGLGFTWVAQSSALVTVHSGKGVVVKGADDEQATHHSSERDMIFPGTYVSASVGVG